MYIIVFLFIYTLTDSYMYVCMSVCMYYVCIYECMYVFIYIHIYMYVCFMHVNFVFNVYIHHAHMHALIVKEVL